MFFMMPMFWATVSLSLAGTTDQANTWMSDSQSGLTICVPGLASTKAKKKEKIAITAAHDALRREAWEEAASLAEGSLHEAMVAVRAAVALQKGDLIPALNDLQRLLADHTDDACLLATTGFLSGVKGDNEISVLRLKRARVLDPTSVEVVVLMAQMHPNQMDVQGVSLLEQALASGQSSPRIRLALATALLEDHRDAAALPHIIEVWKSGYDQLAVEVADIAWKVSDLDAYLSAIASFDGMPLDAVGGTALGEAESPWSDYLSALGLSEGQSLIASIETSMGPIRCELFPDRAPVTVANFVGLATGKQAWTDKKTGSKGDGPLYSGSIFHRVISGFMIQGGDPEGTGMGGPGYRFPDEVSGSLQFTSAGVLAMANSGPSTNGSQFFITDGPTPHLNGKHTIFGQCDELDLVSRIASVPSDQSRPTIPVFVDRINITVEDAK